MVLAKHRPLYYLHIGRAPIQNQQHTMGEGYLQIPSYIHIYTIESRIISPEPSTTAQGAATKCPQSQCTSDISCLIYDRTNTEQRGY